MKSQNTKNIPLDPIPELGLVSVFDEALTEHPASDAHTDRDRRHKLKELHRILQDELDKLKQED